MADHPNEDTTIEYLLKRIQKLEEERVASEVSVLSRPLQHPIEAIPTFSGEELGESADTWCDMVEEITKDLTSTQRLCSATHALTGSAKEWYRTWRGNPRTWTIFRQDLCSIYTTEDRLGQLLRRAVLYTSDDAASYSEYARTKLKYFTQTKISFTPMELVRLVIASVMDSTTRQSLTNARYTTTADLLTGIALYIKRRRDPKDQDHRKNPSKRPYSTSRPGKRCFVCDSMDHVQSDCPKRQKIAAGSSRPPSKHTATCTYCTKRGHEEDTCWLKQRAQRFNAGQSPTENISKTTYRTQKGKPEVNACYSMPHQPTPVIIRDCVVRNCLIDSGGLQMLINEDGTSRLVRCPSKLPQEPTSEMQPLACVAVDLDEPIKSQLNSLLNRYRHMSNNDNIIHNKVKTARLDITLKEGKTGRPQVAPKDRLRLWKGEWAGDEMSSDDEDKNEPC
ncbi:uncharacterized protein LOC143363497 [Halictus rubicundus]|uniref:uncharacterized protein LOC143363497 n=1 Tax=Halictus rubicundus TaxID=77578 RepID=UPI004036F531